MYVLLCGVQLSLQVVKLKKEIESLEDELDHAENNESSMSQGDSCGNCSQSGSEIRQYLGIIQSLTEDKLSLEKTLSDIRRDKEQLLVDIESITQEKFVVQSDLNGLRKDMEESGQKFQTEMEYLLQNMENIEQENKTLEEHLQKARQNKLDMLGDLSVVEEDRLGSVRSLQDIKTERKVGARRSSAGSKKSESSEDSVFSDKGKVVVFS